jgi:ribosome-associated protein
MISVTPRITIGEDEVQFKFIRASGPGGQNVNKVATAVQLRFDVVGSPSLDAQTRLRLAQLAGRKLNENGILVIEARRFRTQARNRQDAIDRLVAVLRKAAEIPKPRRKTRPTLASRKRRLEGKRRRGVTKRNRKPPAD